MKNTNYKQVYQKLTKGLSEKTKDIFDRRFGVKTKNPETLESIGKSMGITRERVRQIEEAGFNVIRKQNKEALDNIFKEFSDYFKTKGGLKKEESALEELGGPNQRPYVLFFLTLGDAFSRVCEKKDFHYFWSILPDAPVKVKETLNSFAKDFQEIGSPLSKKDFVSKFASKYNFSESAVLSYFEVSKRIQQNSDEKLGLIDWPEIKPKGVKDKAFLVFKKNNKPLHFTKVAELIDQLGLDPSNKKTFPQTVHNELIKDNRFVLVGRGTYALGEWGYTPGTIKDLIVKILEKRQEPADKNDIVKEVLAQRLVAKNTVLMNLNNKKYFEKNDRGNYLLRKTQTA